MSLVCEADRGMRGLFLSRELGDVYKRQEEETSGKKGCGFLESCQVETHGVPVSLRNRFALLSTEDEREFPPMGISTTCGIYTVPYTHLTLPTRYSP